MLIYLSFFLSLADICNYDGVQIGVGDILESKEDDTNLQGSQIEEKEENTEHSDANKSAGFDDPKIVDAKEDGQNEDIVARRYLKPASGQIHSSVKVKVEMIESEVSRSIVICPRSADMPNSGPTQAQHQDMTEIRDTKLKLIKLKIKENKEKKQRKIDEMLEKHEENALTNQSSVKYKINKIEKTQKKHIKSEKPKINKVNIVEEGKVRSTSTNCITKYRIGILKV